MDIFQIIISILVMILGIIFMINSRNLDKIPAKKGDYSPAQRARNAGIFFFGLGLIILFLQELYIFQELNDIEC